MMWGRLDGPCGAVSMVHNREIFPPDATRERSSPRRGGASREALTPAFSLASSSSLLLLVLHQQAAACLALIVST